MANQPTEPRQLYFDDWQRGFKAIGEVALLKFAPNWQKFAVCTMTLFAEPFLDLTNKDKKMLFGSWVDVNIEKIKFSPPQMFSALLATNNEKIKEVVESVENEEFKSPTIPQSIWPYVSYTKILNPFKLVTALLNVTCFSLSALADTIFPNSQSFQYSSAPAMIMKSILVSPLKLILALARPLADIEHIIRPIPDQLGVNLQQHSNKSSFTNNEASHLQNRVASIHSTPTNMLEKRASNSAHNVNHSQTIQTTASPSSVPVTGGSIAGIFEKIIPEDKEKQKEILQSMSQPKPSEPNKVQVASSNNSKNLIPSQSSDYLHRDKQEANTTVEETSLENKLRL